MKALANVLAIRAGQGTVATARRAIARGAVLRGEGGVS